MFCIKYRINSLQIGRIVNGNKPENEYSYIEVLMINGQQQAQYKQRIAAITPQSTSHFQQQSQQMFDLTDPSLSIQMCKFQALIQKAHIVIKFPCSYFIEWKTINNRYSICTQKRVRTANDEAVFNERLTFYTEMVYNSKKKEYYSKETFLLLNLVSKSRPDQVKLVGRVSVDLAQVLNRSRYAQVQRVRLNYCSVEGSVVFGVKLINKRESNLSVKDLDRSAFTDYFSLNPINRMMIEESINNSNSNNRMAQQHQNQQQHYRQKKQYLQRQNQQSMPKFGQAPQNSANANKQTYHSYPPIDQQVISFQNSQRQEPFLDQSPRTNYSRQQSLIQKLQEKNLRASEKEYTKQSRQQRRDNNIYQKVGGNVVEVQRREQKTQRVNNNGSEINGHDNNSSSNYTIGARNRSGLNRVEEEAQTGQIRRQQTTINSTKTSGQAKPQQSTAISKPTSPPSHQRQLTHVNSSSKFSQTSQSQNQQLLSIVQKLQHQKLQQQSMIQSLKAMLIGKNMRKKQPSRTSQPKENDQKRHQQIIQENNALRKENDSLLKQIERKGDQLKQKNMHVFELLDKIKKLEMELARHDQKIKMYEDEIADLHMKEIQNQKVCESLKLSLTMQPGYDNLVKTKGDELKHGKDIHNNAILNDQNDDSMGMITKKSSKLLDYFKTPNQPNTSHKNQLQTQKLSMSQQQPQPQEQFKITITKDQKIYQQIQQQNYQLSQRVKQLLQQIEIYKDLLKNQNTPQYNLQQSIPLPQVVTTNNLDTDQVPFTITVSKNTNIYQNYENLEQENNELYDRIKELQQQVEGYKQLIRDEGYDNRNKENAMVESVEVQEMGEYQAVVNSKKGRGVNESQPPKTVTISESRKVHQFQQTKQQQYGFETTPIPHIAPQQLSHEPISETFKIILTKDKSIYKQQQQQNIQLSKRVIQLQQQIATYKQLLKNQHNAPTSNNIHPATIQNQQHYEGEGFTITLTKDKNIFENQEKEISQYQQQVRHLQETVQKYKSLYGPINAEPEYKVSITRQDRIYEDQEQEIKELLKALQEKDDQVMELMTRLSWLQRQLEFRDEKMGNQKSEKMGMEQGFGEFKINIHRDQNIYDEQEKDIKDLSERILELEQKLRGNNQELSEKSTLIETLNKQLAEIKSIPVISNTNSQAIKPFSTTPSHLPLSRQLPTQTAKPSREFTPATVSCLSCISLQNRLLQLQTTIQLLEQQKTMLQQQLGTLEQEKFCFTSTQNQLKITIEDLRDQINLLGQENERLVEEVQYLHKMYGIGENGQGDNRAYGSLKVDQRNNGEIRGNDYQMQHHRDIYEDAANRSKFALSLPEHVINQYKQTHQQPINTHKPTTHHLQQLPPASPRSKHSQQPPSPSKLLLSLQQQNTHLRQSLQTFQEQLQQQYLTIGELQQRIARLMHEKEILFERDQQLSKEIILLSEKEQQVNEREVRFRDRIGDLQRELTAMKAQSLSTISTSHLTRKDSNEHSTNSSKFRTLQLQRQGQSLKQQLNQLTLTLSNQSQQLSSTQQQLLQCQNQLQTQQTQLQQKQRQIHQLQTELQSLNQSLTELSISYQSLQNKIVKLQQQKESQVESIRQEYESMNRLLKDELESIESIILEKQRICEENQKVLRDREQQIIQLERVVEEIKMASDTGIKEIQQQLAQATSKLRLIEGENEDLKAQIDSFKISNEQITKKETILTQQIQEQKKQILRLQQLKPQIPLSPQELNYKQKLLAILSQIKQFKAQSSIQLSQLLPLITQKLNQSQFPCVIHGEQQLARLISKQVQKIKINIMRNYHTSTGGKEGVIQRTVPINTGYNQEFKSFAEKSAMLNYLKPIEELIKGY